MSEAIQPPPGIEERLAELERRFTQLCDEVLGLKPVKKDWRATVGMMPDDELSREAQRLGEEWRRQEP